MAAALIVVLAAGLAMMALRRHPRENIATIVDRGRALFAEQKYSEAADAARYALQIDPLHIPATQILVDVMAAKLAPEEVLWRNRLLEISPGDLSNRLHLTELALEMGNLPFAAKVLTPVEAAGQTNAHVQQLAGRLALAEGKKEAAEIHFSRAVQLEPAKGEYQLSLAQLHLEGASPEQKAEARKICEQLIKDPAHFRRASQLLVKDALREKMWFKALRFSRALQQQPEAVFEDRLLYLSLLHQLRPTEFPGYLASVQEVAAQDPAKAFDLITWLHTSKNSARAIAWAKQLPRETWTKMPVPVALTHCYIATGDWRGVKPIVSPPLPPAVSGEEETAQPPPEPLAEPPSHWGVHEFMRLAVLARALREEGLLQESRVQWNNAVREAADRADATSFLARSSLEWRWEKEATDMLWIIARGAHQPMWALDILYRRYLASHSTRNLYAVLSRMHELDSANPWVKNNFASLSLLLETNIAPSLSACEELYKQEPDNPTYATTYAYALHLHGHTDKGLEVMKALGLKRLEEPQLAIYYGLLLATTDAREEARKFLEIGKTAALLPEEKKLFERAWQTVSGPPSAANRSSLSDLTASFTTASLMRSASRPLASSRARD